VALVTSQRDGAIALLARRKDRACQKASCCSLSGDEDLRAQLRQAELEVKRLQVEQRQLEALTKLDRNEFDGKAFGKDGFTSQHDVEHAQFKFEAASLELEKSRVASQSAQSKIEAVKLNSRKPPSALHLGLVTHRYVEVGSSVARNDKLLKSRRSRHSRSSFNFRKPKEHPWAGERHRYFLVDSDTVVASAEFAASASRRSGQHTFGYVAE